MKITISYLVGCLGDLNSPHTTARIEHSTKCYGSSSIVLLLLTPLLLALLPLEARDQGNIKEKARAPKPLPERKTRRGGIVGLVLRKGYFSVPWSPEPHRGTQGQCGNCNFCRQNWGEAITAGSTTLTAVKRERQQRKSDHSNSLGNLPGRVLRSTFRHFTLG